MEGNYTAEELRNEADGWRARPEELPVGLPPVEPFALELLPEALRDWISDIAERMQCPIDFPAVAMMITLGGVVGRKVGIRPKAEDEWTVPPNLWGSVIGRPSILKSPAIAEPIAMVSELENRARREYEEAVKEHEADELVREAKDKEVKVNIAKAIKANDENEAKKLASKSLDRPEAPVRRRYLTQDATVEKLGELLRDNDKGIILYRDELIGFLKTLDQEGRESSRAFYLEAWNGTGSFTFDRIGRGTIHIEAACVSILGSIQPGPLSDYLTAAVAGGTGDDGLMQRFQLAVWPDTGKTWINVDRRPNAEAKQKAREVYGRLDKLNPTAIGAKQGEYDPQPWLRFSPAAQDRFNQWRSNLEARLRTDELHPAMESHLAKYRSLVPSLALLIHLVDHELNADSNAVSDTSLLRALSWADYLESHAKRIYHPALSKELYGALELHRRLRSLPEPFTAKDVYRNHWRGLDIDGTRNAIQVLIDFGHIRIKKDESEPGKGRPTTRYEVHPELRKPSR